MRTIALLLIITLSLTSCVDTCKLTKGKSGYGSGGWNSRK